MSFAEFSEPVPAPLVLEYRNVGNRVQPDHSQSPRPQGSQRSASEQCVTRRIVRAAAQTTVARVSQADASPTLAEESVAGDELRSEPASQSSQ